ncbi:Putative lysine methyltransferase, S-adenosyl-L-methionine-dependent methyltransferase [Septoria linicola]|uniref:Lysine methyltransferase, S-adenosyl-L-methionine-dependent methyltransferase n=1 Tax=Septoria linicola TaxID=215465 RepID=A0A9Q9EP68_9PEZI|nr:Putative lysine methyltransferase, S-adenosyl-L-methionine-dependent methyltransferase [Septoria linicola]
MHYIRFLKTPKVHVDRATILLKAVLTITTDLGETFYPNDLDLVVSIRAPEDDGDIYLRKRVQWQAGARSLNVSIDLSRQDVEWPACVHVAVRGTKVTDLMPPFADVWSGTLNPIKGQFESGWRVERRFKSVGERALSLLEDAGDSIARHLWDGSQALAQHIDQIISLQDPETLPLLEYVLISATYRRTHIIELGCGCGTVGISVAQTIPDCDVLLTDLDEAEELVEANIARMNPAMSSKARFQSLDWLQPLPANLENRKNDLIIVSECTYNTDTLEPLVGMLVSLVARSPKAVIVVSTKTRHDSEAAFFDLMKNAGLVEEGNMRLALPGEPGQGYSDWATDVGMHVFRGKDHRLSLSPRNNSEEEVPTRRRERRSKSR